jgi:protocatechuate 3,4-dioxygenase beta subunit
MLRLTIRAAFAALLLCLAFPSVAAPPEVDGRALALAQQLASFAQANANRGVVDAAARKRHAALRDSAERLLLDIEAGRARLSAQPELRLRRAIEQLDAVPVDLAAGGKAAKANGTLSGTVVDAATGTPVGVNVVRVTAFVYQTQLSPTGAGVVGSAFTNASGQYTLTLPPGDYVVRTTINSSGYINQGFGVGNCVDALFCPRYVGTVVNVPDGGTAVPVNFSMPLGGRISGTVRRSDTSATLSGVTVIAQEEGGNISGATATDASGNYTIANLVPGRYIVYVAAGGGLPPGFLTEVHPNVSCADFDCVFQPGLGLVTVAGTATTPGIDFSLDPGLASVSGTVVELGTGTPIADDGSFTAFAWLVSDDGTAFHESLLGAGGAFSFPRVKAGSYRLFAGAPGYIGKVATGFAPVTTIDCLNAPNCDAIDIGAELPVAAAANLTGIVLPLDRGATIAGTVRTLAGATPVNGAVVTVWGANATYSANTDASGTFAVRGLPAGTYYLSADAPTQNLVNTYLGGVSCRGFHCVNLGTPVTVAAGGSVGGLTIDLPQGGTLSGLIIDGATGLPAPRQTRLELFDTSGRLIVQQVTSGVSGYTVAGLPPGAYRAVFASSGVLGWVDTAFGGLPCPRGGCDQSLLPSVFVTAGATTSGIGATLPRGARIRGRVTDAATGLGIRNPAFGGSFSNTIAFNNNLSNYAGFAQLDFAGRYVSRTGLPPGPYFPSTFLLRNNTPIGQGYIDELYDDRPCPWASCGITTGTPVSVGTTDLAGVDFALSRGGAISGTITESAGGTPLGGVEVRAFNGAGDQVALGRSNAAGRYSLRGLPAGSYFLVTQNALGYVDEAFSNLVCEPFCNPVTGTAVAVAGTTTTGGRDFVLDRARTIAGTVTDGGPAPNVPVEIYGQIGNLLRTVTTNASGQYSVSDLAPGLFYVRTRNTTGRADDLYWQAGNPLNTSTTDPDCVGLACQVRRGTPLNLQSAVIAAGVNLALTAPGAISGTVTNQATSAPMSGVSLQLLDARGAVVETRSTSASGTYAFTALAAGSYYLVSRGTPGFIDEAFPNNPCPASCNGLNGSAIPVVAGTASSGNNLVLSTGGSISGTVRNASNNLPIGGTSVQVYTDAGVPVAQIGTNASGNYEVNNLADNGAGFSPTGYRVRTQNGLGFINEVFQNRACGGFCDLPNGDGVSISGGGAVGLVDFFLDTGGAISGRITQVAGGAGIALAEVTAIDVNGLIAGRATTNATGNYTIGGLQPGSYKVRTSNTAGFVNQVYRTPTPLPCSPTPCALSSGTAVVVAGPVSGIDLALAAGGTISGTAADLFNNPLPSGTATLLDASGAELQTIPVSNGLFEFNGLASGSYYVLIRNTSGLIDLLFPNEPCPAGACNITAVGTPIVISGTLAGLAPRSVASVANVDLRLPTGRAVGGRVTRAGAPVGGVTVYVYDAAGNVVGSGTSDALGDWITAGSLPAGAGTSYYAATTSPVSRGARSGLVNEAWNNVACMQDCNVPTVGAVIALPAAAAPLLGIDFDLQPGGGLRGTVTRDSGGALPLVMIEVYDAGARLVGSAATDSLGRWQVDGLVGGQNYFLRTVNVLGLGDELFGGVVCEKGCNVLDGQPVTFSGTGFRENTDFVLGLPPDPLFANGFEN